MDALRRMALTPAQRLEAPVPAMRTKGRIRVAANADLAAFDPDRVIDKVTFENAAQYSEGIEHVMVGRRFVIRNGKFVNGVFPGEDFRKSEVRTMKTRIPTGSSRYMARGEQIVAVSPFMERSGAAQR